VSKLVKLSVAYNWDPTFIDEVVKRDYPVTDFYASAQHTTIGGGRPSSILPETSEKMIKSHIQKMHDNGIEFTYTLNAACMGGQEFVKETHVKMIKELEAIQDAGADGVVLAIPYLIEIVKEQFPGLKIRVSTVAKVNAVNKAIYFEKMGADSISPDVMINRNFKLLQKMVEGTRCTLDLLVTDGCLYECPYRLYHYCLTGHASQTYNNRDAFIDYPVIKCNIEKYSNPAEIMKCRWVRPEDLKHYEAIGIHLFKIGGRRLTTDRILASVKAYSEQEYAGNLANIIEGFAFENGGIKSDPNKKMGSANAKECKANLIIDNTKLDGFIDFFIEHGESCAENCGTCSYCEKWAEKAVILDKHGAEMFLNNIREFHQDLITSREFGLNLDKKKSPTKKNGMTWDPSAEKNFETIIERSPSATRSMARMLIASLAEKKARNRGAQVVENQDVASAFLEGVPGPFQKSIKKGLKELGIKAEA